MLKEINPVDFSLQECEFLYKHVGEPSVVALQDIKPVRLPNPHPKDKNPIYYPDGVVPAAVKPILDGIQELIELEAHKGIPWVGVDVVKAGFQTYLTQAAKWSEQRGRRGAPRFPSMASYDGKNRPHLNAPGSDSGKVTSYFDKTGHRLSFIIQLQDDNVVDWKPDWVVDAAEPASNPAARVDPKAAILTNDEFSRVECLVCGHTESFKAESRASFNAARARMSKHLRSAKVETSLHREAHANEFGA